MIVSSGVVSKCFAILPHCEHIGMAGPPGVRPSASRRPPVSCLKPLVQSKPNFM